VVLEGKDTKNNKVQRTESTRVSTALSTVRVVLNVTASFSLKPGESVSIPVDITNTGSEDTYTITVTDSLGYFQSFSPSASVTLAQDETKRVTLLFSAPSDADVNQVSSATVTATSSSSSDQNFVVFRVATVPENLDITPASCTIDETTGNCAGTKAGTVNCENDMWSFKFTAMDSGTGLYLIRRTENITGAIFEYEVFEQGTTNLVSGQYSSTCCSPRITVVASDLYGNNGRCTIEHISPTTPPMENEAVFTTVRGTLIMALLTSLALSASLNVI
jgi:hypothetical protein